MFHVIAAHPKENQRAPSAFLPLIHAKVVVKNIDKKIYFFSEVENSCTKTSANAENNVVPHENERNATYESYALSFIECLQIEEVWCVPWHNSVILLINKCAAIKVHVPKMITEPSNM